MPGSKYRPAIRAFFDDECDLAERDYMPGELLFSTGRLDSFKLLNVVMFAEETLGRKLKTQELTLHNFDSLERIEQFLAANDKG